MGNKKRILIAPLDWGLGHATRCIPIANAIEKSGNEVIFASNGRALDLLMKEFPKNKFIKIPSYNIKYSKYGGIGWILNMTLQIPKIISIIKKENKALQNIIDDFKIDGDFIESQAFAYLAVRSLYKKTISFPSTTNVKKAITGGEIIKID